MLLVVLVREFESRRGEILGLFAKIVIIKRDQLLREPSAGKHNSTRVDEARKQERKSSRDKNARDEP